MSPLHPFDERKYSCTSGAGMDDPEPFGFNPAGSHPTEHLHHPPRRIDRVHTTPFTKGMSGGGKEIPGISFDFMPSDGLFRIGIHPTRAESPIGRIEDSRIEGPGRADRLRKADITPADFHTPGEVIHGRTPSGHHREFLLDLDPEDLPAAIAIRQDQGNHTASRPQIDQIIPLSQAGKMGKEEGVQGKAIPSSLLDDSEAAPEDPIDRLVGFIGETILIHCHSSR